MGKTRFLFTAPDPIGACCLKNLPPFSPFCIALSGSTILKGNGRILVIETGRLTTLGSIFQLSQSVEKDLTPIQKELQDFVKKNTYLALGIGLLF
ncbi:MAG: magnesium-transporting ATPase (P-type), partial [Chlamydiales bacterium]